MTRLRTPASAITVVALLVVVASVVTWALLRGPADGGEGSRETRTLLLQVRDDDGAAVGNVLVAGGLPAVSIVLPRTLLVPVPEPLPLERTSGLPDTLAARNGVSALLGVRVDAALSIDRLSLAALVDAVGGVPVDVRSRIVERDADGAVVVSILPGSRVLDGASAAAYALVPQQGEAQEERQARLTDVLSRVVLRLPSSRSDLRAIVVSLGSSARATEATDAIVEVLGELREAITDGTLASATLPVVALVDGTASAMARPEGEALVRTMLPGALLAPGQSPLPRVELRRAGAPLGRSLAAEAQLADDGLAVVAVTSGAAETDSIVLIPETGARATGERVAAALGLPPTAVRVADLGPAPVPDAVAVLGPVG